VENRKENKGDDYSLFLALASVASSMRPITPIGSKILRGI